MASVTWAETPNKSRGGKWTKVDELGIATAGCGSSKRPKGSINGISQ